MDDMMLGVMDEWHATSRFALEGFGEEEAVHVVAPGVVRDLHAAYQLE